MVSVHHPDSANRKLREGGNGGASHNGVFYNWGEKFCFIFPQKNASSKKIRVKKMAILEGKEKA